MDGAQRDSAPRLAAIRRDKIVLGDVEFEKVTTPEPEFFCGGEVDAVEASATQCDVPHAELREHFEAWAVHAVIDKRADGEAFDPLATQSITSRSVAFCS
jgi:hypothetical protein